LSLVAAACSETPQTAFNPRSEYPTAGLDLFVLIVWMGVIIGVIEVSHVKRIWPVIVVADGLFQNPTLWAWTHREGGHHLQFDVADVPQQSSRS